MTHTEPYIDPDIVIDEPLPAILKNLIKDLEEYDAKGQDYLYFDRADDVWVNAKNAYAEGMISKKTWDLITEKYVIHANIVGEKEDKQ